MLDVIVAGAGPAGAIAALVLARAGARVLIVDRETFPRDKLCGDTLNPGALAMLRSLGLSGGPIDQARPLRGMFVSGPHLGVRTEYGGGIVGRAILRRDLDAWLLAAAVHAGARFEERLVARQPLMDGADHALVRGLVLAPRGREEAVRIPASIAIVADGRRSAVARAAGLVVEVGAPRRWAFGGYASGIDGLTDVGEMHIRGGYYVGIAPITETLSNVCVVTPHAKSRSPLEVVRAAIARDSGLAARFARAEFVGPISVLGPLAVEARAAGLPGLLLAGDAAGFIDPMTGDGLALAMHGGWLAAREALRALETGDAAGAPARLAATRRSALGARLRFNRAVRTFVEIPGALPAAEGVAAIAPAILRGLVRYAGDVSGGGFAPEASPAASATVRSATAPH